MRNLIAAIAMLAAASGVTAAEPTGTPLVTHRCIDPTGRPYYTNVKADSAGRKCTLVSSKVTVVPNAPEASSGSAATKAAGEWELIVSVDAARVYADRPTARRRGNLTEMWTLQDNRLAGTLGKDGYFSVIDHREYDCQTGRIRGLYSIFHARPMGQGSAIYSGSRGLGWAPFTPGTLDEIVWQFACREY